MKKLTSVLLAALTLFSAVLFTGCNTTASGSSDASGSTSSTSSTASASDTSTADTSTAGSTLVIGASVTPHAEILAVAKEILAEEGITLEIREYTDYVTPNTALEDGDLDANYFQHFPYLEDFNTNNNTHLVSAGAVHYEPFGIYAGKTASIEALQDGATIAVPNDGSNEARALLLLQAQGLIKLKADANFNATVLDIEENPKNLKIQEIEAAQLARVLKDVDLAVINGNYALQAGLNASTDALATEDKNSDSATTYANVIAVREGDENRADIKALMEALKSEKVKEFIETKYAGAVVAVD